MHVLDTDGGEPERVTDLPLGAGAPVWSPDSARLAFSAPVDPGTGGPLVADRLDYQADGAGMFGSVRSQVHVVDARIRRLPAAHRRHRTCARARVVARRQHDRVHARGG